MGREGYAFRFRGADDRYSAYWDLRLHELGQIFITVTRSLKQRLADGVALTSLLVPNKESCLPALYPLLLPRRHTTASEWIRAHIDTNDKVTLCDSLTGDDAFAMWRKWDSRVSPLGAVTILNEILVNLGLNPITDIKRSPGRRRHSGDLSTRWDNHTHSAPDTWDLRWDRPDPERIFGGAPPAIGGDQGGWSVTWTCADPLIDADVCIVGGETAGNGDHQQDLTWWAARTFRRATFIHAPWVPIDLLDHVACDYLIYQISENFTRSISDERGLLETVSTVTRLT
jgi:hypothetical protein